MKIETKFDMGDTVWVVKLRPKYKPCPKCGGPHMLDNPWRVEKFVVDHVRAYAPITGQSYYGDATDLLSDSERNCFPTEAEAQAECDRRNAEETDED